MGRQLSQCFRDAGFSITTDPSQADIIFAHSGGCFLIPPVNKASKIVLVGLPYWPGRPWLMATVLKVWREVKLYIRKRRIRYWLKKWLYHIRYAFSVGPAIRMARNMKSSGPWNGKQSQFIIRNRHDMYSSPALYKLAWGGPRTFISLPGEHDDCWDNPHVYADLLRAL
jgi:hypothetical protein